MERREFVKGAAAAIGALACSSGATRAIAEGSEAAERSARASRIVRAVSIGFESDLSPDSVVPLARIADRVEREAAQGTDIIVLPEHCQGCNERSQETLDGPTITAMAELARKHRTYIVCPIDRRDGKKRFNSAVLLDRSGKVVSIYNKMYPVYPSECELTPPVLPGDSARVYGTDFGKLGFAICFDVNWPSLWRQLSNLGAEVVVFPSAYSAGRSLQAHAIDYNYYVLSSTRIPDCLVYDIDGELLVHDHENAGKGANVTRVELDLDRCIFHQDNNLPDKLNRLLKARGSEVEQEKWLPMEGWFVLRAKQPGVSAKELAQQYGLETLRHYINRSQCEIDRCRGWEFV
jgi:predicted amidohydrolase